MKKDSLKSIITIVLVGILTSTITAYATSYLYNSNEVSYDHSSSGLEADDVQGAIDELYEHATDYTEVRAMIYPVGSIYLSVTDDTVAKVQARFGGTWEAFGSGKTLVGVNTSETEFSTVEKTGGEKTHTLTISEMPNHNHNFNFGAYNSGASATTQAGSYPVNLKQDYKSNWSRSDYITSTGGGGAHNNLQPYITVYMYKRIA